MIVQIVRRQNGERVGSIQVEANGSMRIVSGPEDLRQLVERRLATGIIVPRSVYNANGDQFAVAHTLLPTESEFEDGLSSRLIPLGLLHREHEELVAGRVEAPEGWRTWCRDFLKPAPHNAR